MTEKTIRIRKKKKLGSYPYFSVVFSVTLSLFVIGLFGLLMLHASKLTDIIRDNIEVQVYLTRDISQNQRIKILKSLSAKDYVARSGNEAQISFISKKDAEKQFIKETGEDFTAFLGENPLKDVYVIKIAPGYQDTESLKRIQSEIEQEHGVFEAIYSENLVNSINNNMAQVSLLLLGFAVILLTVVIILINNTIKLALFSQRFLIRSMQLVGATSSFIQRPFLSRALLYGITGGAIASALLHSLLYYANSRIENLAALQEKEKMVALYLLLLIIGGGIGLFSSYRAIRKYLKLSLDELY